MYLNIGDIKRMAYHKGSHFFDESALRFFKSRILRDVYQGEGGVYFVTSERREETARRYSVRQFFPNSGVIETVGEFNVLSQNRAKQIASLCAVRGARFVFNSRKDAWNRALVDKPLVVTYE